MTFQAGVKEGPYHPEAWYHFESARLARMFARLYVVGSLKYPASSARVYEEGRVIMTFFWKDGDVCVRKANKKHSPEASEPHSESR